MAPRGLHPAAVARTTAEARRGRAVLESIWARWPALMPRSIRAIQGMPRGRARDALRLYANRRGYAAFNRRDWELNTIAHHRERYQLTGNLGRFLPDAKEEYHGIEGYLEAMGLWLSTWEGLRCVIPEVEVHEAPDGRVVSIHRWLARGQQSGVELDLRLADVQTFDGGWITSQTLFTDPNEALRFVGLGPGR